MKLLRLVLVFIALYLTCKAVPVHAVDTIPYIPPPTLIDSPVIVTAYALAGGTLNYVQLYNKSSTPVDISGWQVEYDIASQTTPVLQAALSGLLAPTNYVVLADTTAGITNADFSYTLDTALTTATPTHIRLVPSPLSNFAMEDTSVKASGIFQRNKSTSTGNYLSTFATLDEAATLYGGGFYDAPVATALQFSEVLANPRDCSPLDNALDCADYVKLYNPTIQPIDLSAFRVRFGYNNQNATASNTYTLTGILAPGHYATITISADNRPLSISASGGYMWLEDTYGITKYDTTVQTYAAASTNNKGQAWAYDVTDGSWKWTTQPMPTDVASVFPVSPPAPVQPIATAAATLVPCQPNQYRSEETNRCRLITAAGAQLTPCKEGEYRSEVTNRCRSIATAAAASLTPCGANEERNPDTNRCRSIAQTANTVTPCKAGQERNPATNRCRAIASTAVPEAAFAVQPLAETGTSFVGWWALGGVGVLALGYAGWEWRQEVGSMIRKVGPFFTAHK